jgi:hypothetical protein
VGGTEIAGQVSATYTPRPDDAGKVISVIVTARLAGHAAGTVEVTTPAVARRTASAPTPTVTVTATPAAVEPSPAASAPLTPLRTATSGVPLVFTGKLGTGTLLSAADLVPQGARAKFKWTRDGKAIPKAVGRTYNLRPRDAGREVMATATVTMPDGSTTVIHSAGLAVPKLTPVVKAKLTSASVKAKVKAKVKVTIKVAGIAAPTGKISVKYGAKTKVYVLSKAKKGVATLTLPRIAKKGTYTVKVTYLGSPHIATKAAKAERLRVR